MEMLEATKVADEEPLAWRSTGIGIVFALGCYWVGDATASLTMLIIAAGWCLLRDWECRRRMSKARLLDLHALKNPKH